MFHLLLVIIYLSFISLGLPDGLLGAAWPVIYPEMNVPVSYSGIIFMIISAGTVVSSLQSDWLTKRFGTAKVTAVSVGITMLALFGFSSCHSFLVFCLLYTPCVAAIASVKRELGAPWAAGVCVMQCVVAWIVALVAHLAWMMLF